MKRICCILLSLSLIFSVFAIAGINEKLPSESGEYVYYRDFTFTDETYIGFLIYDNSTIGTRFYTKSDISDTSNPSVEILFTVNPESSFLELTGEKIITQITNEDVDKVNYIHDIFYELSSHRKQVNDVDFSTNFSQTQSFAQFGGDVQIEYDKFIPIFNLHSISDFSGKILLQAVTIGSLSDSADTSFSSFTGFENLDSISLKKTKKIKAPSKSKIKTLDSAWKIIPNIPGEFKTLNNDAVYWKISIEIPVEKQNSVYSINDYLLKTIRLSSKDSYIYYPSVSLSENSQITSMLSFSSDKQYSRILKKLSKENETTFTLLTLTSFENWFQKNSDYLFYLLSN